VKPLGLERNKGTRVDLGHMEYIYHTIYIYTSRGMCPEPLAPGDAAVEDGALFTLGRRSSGVDTGMAEVFEQLAADPT
jgi:hypothetical protein